MTSIIAKLRDRIQHPNLTTTMNKFWPRDYPLFPPTTIAVVENAEVKLGFRLPTLLREIYTQVGNGGFGPGYGIVGLEGGFLETDNLVKHDGTGVSLVDFYFGLRGVDNNIPELNHDFEHHGSYFVQPESWGWFNQLVPICNWGCWHLSCIDCSKSDMPVLFFVGYGCEFKLQSKTFDTWIEDWVNGIDLWVR